MAFVWGEIGAVRRRPNLNLIKKIGEGGGGGGGGGGNPTTLPVSSLVSEFCQRSYTVNAAHRR